MMMNRIKTNEEYLAEGFLAEEVELVRESDLLFNKSQLEKLTEEEVTRYNYLVNLLGL